MRAGAGERRSSARHEIQVVKELANGVGQSGVSVAHYH